MRQQVEAYRLGHERERTGYQRLRRDDRGRRAEHYRQRAQHLGQHLEEGVEHLNALKLRVALIADEPRALTEIIEYQAYFHERPRGIDIVRTDMTHVGVERFRACRGEEHAAEDHKADLVVGAVQHLHRVHGVKCLQHGRQVEYVHKSGDAEEAEPDEHDGAEGLADAARSGALHEKQREDYRKRQDYHAGLPRAEERVHHGVGAQTLDRRRHRDRGGQYAVGQHRRAADHRRKDQPLAAAAHQRVQREDAALAVVVGAHGDENVLYRRQQGYRPDNERQRADDQLLRGLREAAVALDDRLHDVHRRGADVAVDDADGYSSIAKLTFFLFAVLFPMISDVSFPDNSVFCTLRFR